MADISKVVLPSGSSYNIKDATARSHLTYTNVTFGTCETAAGTAEKAVTLASGVTGWELQPGAIIAVKFTNTNTAASPKLNVNGTGAKPIYYKSGVVTSSYIGAGGIASYVYEYIYDGTNFVFLGEQQFKGATSEAGGQKGIVPAPAAGEQGKFLRGDGTWAKPTDTVYTHPTYTAVDGKPDADASPGFGGTFTVTDITTNTLGHVTSGTSRTITIPGTVMGGATAEAAGTKGLVPAPAAGKQASFLRGDGAWVVPTNTTNTTGSTNDETNKLFVIGAKTQAASPQTYSNDNVYISSNHLYSNGKQVVNLSDTQALTNKTYNGYTLAAASAKGVDTTLSASSSNLPTSAAVATYVSSVLEPITTALSGGMHYRGVTTTALTNGATTSPIVIDSNNYTPQSGDIVIYGSLEFIFSSTDNKWHEFGSTGSLKALAFKDSASTTYKPAGTVSKPTFTGTEKSVSVTGTPAGTISIGEGTANYTPAGTVSTPTITVTVNTATKYVAASASGGGAVTAGTKASCTLPELTTSVSNETLTFGWTAGSFTANTPTAVTLPTFSSQTIATGIKSATSSQPTFTGTGKELIFTGASLTSTGKYTPAGTVSQPTFTGTSATITVS